MGLSRRMFTKEFKRKRTTNPGGISLEQRTSGRG